MPESKVTLGITCCLIAGLATSIYAYQDCQVTCDVTQIHFASGDAACGLFNEIIRGDPEEGDADQGDLICETCTPCKEVVTIKIDTEFCDGESCGIEPSITFCQQGLPCSTTMGYIAIEIPTRLSANCATSSTGASLDITDCEGTYSIFDSITCGCPN